MAATPTAIKARPPLLQPSLSSSAIPSSRPLSSPTSDGTGSGAISPTNETPGPLSKTYIIPPRPKPGRKPATDTPQTKRKEQNREAQRAFRERRAARVGELEDELAQKTRAWTNRESDLQSALLNQQRAFQREVEALQAQQRSLQQALENEQRLRQAAETELQTMKKQSHRYSASSMTSYPSGQSTPWSQRATSPARHSKPAFPHSQPGSRTDVGRMPSNKDAFDPNCGKCMQDGQCACLNQALERHTNVPRDEPEPMEIDFTTLTARQVGSGSGARASEYAPHDAAPNNESCGFCTDSQNCVCKTYQEAPQPQRPPLQTKHSSTLPTLQGPGTCDKCMEDPERQKFCRMLAQAPAPAGHSKITLPSIDETMSMSCDQAYDTLSKEPAFRDRRNSLSFISQLRAKPASPTRGSAASGAMPPNSALEVDIASVLTAMRAERTREQDESR